MARHLQLVAAAVLLCASWGAHAAYAQASPPSGFSGTAGQWVYQKAANETWTAAKTVRTSAALHVGGRAVTMPAAMRMSANAGVYAARALMLNPTWMAVSAVALWVAGEFWYENDQWWMPGEPSMQTVTCFKETTGTAGVPGISELCEPTFEALVSAVVDVMESGLNAGRVAQGWTLYSCAGPTYVNVINPDFSNFGVSCVAPNPQSAIANRDLRSIRVQQQMPVPGDPVPATEDDFDEFGESQPLPVEVPNAVPVPVPVDLPALNPTDDPNPEAQPLRVPVGEPVAVPDTDPQRYRQPVIDIVPSPTVGEPWRVDVQPKDIEGTDPQGLTDPEVIGEGAPVGAPKDDPQPSLCEQFPNSSACAELGTPTDGESLHTRVVPLSITPVSGFGPSTASCPADRQITLSAGAVIPMPFTLLCEFATGIRPIVVGLAWLSAALAWLGLARRD